MAEAEKKTTTKKTRKKKVVEAEQVAEVVQAVEAEKAPEIRKVRVAVHALNVRKSNGYNNAVVKVVPNDTVFEIAETVDGWGKLNSGEGWICLDFVKEIEA